MPFNELSPLYGLAIDSLGIVVDVIVDVNAVIVGANVDVDVANVVPTSPTNMVRSMDKYRGNIVQMNSVTFYAAKSISVHSDSIHWAASFRLN